MYNLYVPGLLISSIKISGFFLIDLEEIMLTFYGLIDRAKPDKKLNN
jgi:hypothetical protein